jgi:hypothetical protein
MCCAFSQRGTIVSAHTRAHWVYSDITTKTHWRRVAAAKRARPLVSPPTMAAVLYTHTRSFAHTYTRTLKNRPSPLHRATSAMFRFRHSRLEKLNKAQNEIYMYIQRCELLYEKKNVLNFFFFTAICAPGCDEKKGTCMTPGTCQ